MPTVAKRAAPRSPKLVPTREGGPSGQPVKLINKGFSWTEASLKEVMRVFRNKFGRGPANMRREQGHWCRVGAGKRSQSERV